MSRILLTCKLTVLNMLSSRILFHCHDLKIKSATLKAADFLMNPQDILSLSGPNKSDWWKSGNGLYMGKNYCHNSSPDPVCKNWIIKGVKFSNINSEKTAYRKITAILWKIKLPVNQKPFFLKLFRNIGSNSQWRFNLPDSADTHRILWMCV